MRICRHGLLFLLSDDFAAALGFLMVGDIQLLYRVHSTEFMKISFVFPLLGIWAGYLGVQKLTLRTILTE
ncbi:hypothetical protein CH92_21795 [Stutzerimonas stutzeri]|uniref:Uncharacterized protein n=1 Tax=Stutzerimonas stutzeri TaxID=316 RepID=W8R4X3_STUST|nr:hypothetical protein CH92_21795 [Stutzerimonas stutzeri]